MADSVKINLEVATQAADLALKNLKKTTDEANSSFNIFKGSFAAGIALDAIKGAFGAISGFISSVVDESSKAQQSVQNLNVALQNSGLYSEATSQHFQSLADSIELTTAFAGDAVESSVSLLASLTKLDKDGITSATKAAVDLAATLNIDLGTATDMIAKAVNGNVTSFGKLGIEIQKGRTDSENLANTLKALSSQQGAAIKQADTFAGATAKLANQKGKLLESIGNLITQNPLVVEGIKTLTQSFVALSFYIQENQKEITLMAQSLAISIGVIGAAGAAWVTYTSLTGGATLALTALRTAAATAWAAATGPVGITIAAIAAVGVVVYGLIKYWDDVKIATYEATAAVLDYAASVAGAFSSDTEKSIRAEAQALREKADAVRIAQVAEMEAANQRKLDEANKSDGQDAEAVALKQAQEAEQLKKYYAEKRAIKSGHDSLLILSEQSKDLQLQELSAQHEQAMFEISGRYDATRLENQLVNEQSRLLAKQQHEQAVLNVSIEAAKQKALLIEDNNAREKAITEANNKAELERANLKAKQDLEITKQRNKAEEALEKQRANSKKDTWNTILTLQNSSNKELAAAGKAFALYDIAVNTPVAISKAMSAYPPPFNFAAAALVGAAMASQAAAVAGLSFATGGIVPGSSFSGDKVAANVNSREMVLNVQQQKRLFEIANGKAQPVQNTDSTTTNLLLSELIEAVKANTSIQINGRELVAVVRDGLASGRTI